MTTAQQIRQMLSRYLDGNIELDALEDWIATSTWNARPDGTDADAIVLGADIELRLSEYSSGHLPLGQMRDELRNLAKNMPVVNVRVIHSFPDYGPRSENSTPIEIRGEPLGRASRAGTVFALQCG